MAMSDGGGLRVARSDGGAKAVRVMTDSVGREWPVEKDRAIMIRRRMITLLLLAGLCSCKGRHDVQRVASNPSASVPSPRGYDLGAPKKFIMNEALHEISGITFFRNNPDTVYAIEDETGRLYYFHLGSGGFPSRKFGKHGDYEDVTVFNDSEFVVLRSDGTLFTMPVGFVQSGDPGLVKPYPHILPKGEYESLFGDDGGKLMALCKNCPGDDQRDEVSGYVLQYNAQHALTITDHFTIVVPAPELTSIHKKVKFHPSCLARHPLTREWYLISSVNKALIVVDDQWKVKGMYRLDPILFKQPEGLAFDRQGNMYISNEGQQGNANVLVFGYKP
jgi:hypothetical protein